MEKSVLGRFCIFQLVKNQNIVLVNEGFVREGRANFKQMGIMDGTVFRNKQNFFRLKNFNAFSSPTETLF